MSGSREWTWRGARGIRRLTALVLMLIAAAAVRSGASPATVRGGSGEYARQLVASLPRYRPREQVTGTIRIWGHGSPKHDFLGKLLRAWETAFYRYQPGVRIVDDMYGTASAIGALYTGAGDLAILGEEISPAAERAFERERHYAPTRFAVATGSVDVNFFDYAHMIFVNRANPIDRLTVRQLDGIFGDEHRRGPIDIRAWGELGLRGSWAGRPIHPYGWNVDQDFGLFFRARILAGSHRWNPSIRQFVTLKHPDGTVNDRGEQILQALAHDPDGIAISNIRFANPSVKALRLAKGAAGPYVSANSRTLITQTYPLTRIIPAFVDRPPGQPLEAAVREFLRFILSRQGQQILIDASGYLPLGAPQLRAQLHQLDAMSRCPPGGSCGESGGSPRRHSGGPTTSAGRPVAAAAALRASGPLEPARQQPGLRAADADLVRVWGNPALLALAQRWAQGFRAANPHVRIELHMTGSDTGMAGLYTGRADVALLGRTATDSELQAFEWVFRHRPARMKILRGSLARADESPALQVLVARGNPLEHIDLPQLRRLFQPQGTSGTARLRTWGQLGVRGSWANEPVRLYMMDAESGTGRFFRDRVLNGEPVLDWPRISEVSGGAPQILRALAHDPFGLAIAPVPAGTWPVRPLALAVSSSGPYARATRTTVIDGTYALGRSIYAYINVVAGAQSHARAFVRYILSPAGQAAVQSADGFLPLRGAVARAQTAQLAHLH